MSQCVPSWELDDPPPFAPPPHQLLLHYDHQKQKHQIPSHAAVPTSSPAEYEMAELTWKDGSLAMHGLRQPPRVGKPVPLYPSSAATDAGGTLECIVDQARDARLFHRSFSPEIVSFHGGAHHAAADAIVPCTRQREEAGGRKRARVGDVGGGKNCASQGSAAPTVRKNGESTLVTLDTCELTAGDGGTDEQGFSTTPSASPTSAGDQAEGSGGSPETGNGSFAGVRPSAVDDHDSVSHTLPSQRDGLEERGGTSISTKRSRAAAVHNQSERKRRDRINQKMKILQRLLPNSSKTDKASMLDEAIEYLKLLQAQVQMMSRMSPISPMMLPIAMQQQQLHMSLMAHISQMAQIAQMSQMGMGLRIIHPSAFLPLPTTTPAAGAWDASAVEWMQQPGGRSLPDMFSAFMGCPTQQPMSSEAYNRMAALYQQLYHQPPGSNQKT